MQNKTNENNKKNGNIRTDARTNYTLKRSLVLDIAAGVLSVLFALTVWYFTGVAA